MANHAFTRRGFLARSAGVAALAAGTGLLGACTHVQSTYGQSESGSTTGAHVFCGASPCAQGATAYVQNGRLTKLIGDEGRLSATAYGLCQAAYESDRVQSPLKRNAQGSFVAVSWDEALGEIAAAMQSLGADAVGAVHNCGPTEEYYANRLMALVGCTNVYGQGSAFSPAQMAGTEQALGGCVCVPDLGNTDMALIIGSGSDDVRPDYLAALAKARDAGARVVLADARMTADAALAGEWLPIQPGTGLALLLGIAHYLIVQGLYDHGFVDEHGIGFDDWAESLAGHSSSWAAAACGIDRDEVESIAARLAQCAPRAAVAVAPEPGADLGFGNSGETARAAALVNALLGNLNQAGGSYVCSRPSLGDVDAVVADARGRAQAAGAEAYPLCAAGSMPAGMALEAAKDGALRGLVLFGVDVASLSAGAADAEAVLSGLDLVVCVDSFMTRTAQCATHVLPAATLYESEQLPAFAAGVAARIVAGSRAIDSAVPDSRPIDAIAEGIAQACGVSGTWYSFADTLDARLAPWGLTGEGLAHAGSAPVSLEGAGAQEGAWRTASGKIQFASDECAAAGLSAGPAWVDELPEAQDGLLRLMVGSVAAVPVGPSVPCEALEQIASDYGLNRAWVSTEDADARGIAEGDAVRLASECGSILLPAHVTSRIVQGAVFVPVPYGAELDEVDAVNPFVLSELRLEAGYGAGISQGALVSVGKAGA